jgi:EpsI family protein
MQFLLSSIHAKVLTGLLLAQIVAFYALSTKEYVPTMAPLEQLPLNMGSWNMVNQSKPEQEVQDLLKADDALTRVYNRSGETLSIFIAFFKSQRAGVSPHSPRVCLPGAGWTAAASSFIPVTVPGRAEPITINRYVVSRGDNRSIVFYWYQSPHRIVADEISAKLYLVLDSLRYQRSDTSLVRVIVPVSDKGEAHADEVGLEFVKTSFPIVTAHLPN